MNLFELERQFLPLAEWEANLPKMPEALRAAVKSHLAKEDDDTLGIEHNCPFGIGYTEETGWYGLVSCGQGPCIAYMEKRT